MPPPGDYHVHTRFSDGEGEPAQCVERALALGLPEIGITDHLTPSCLGAEGDWSIGHERLGEYVDAVRDAAARYPEITVLLGVEADYVPGAEDELAELLGAHPFDYVIGGLHFVDGFPFDEPALREDARWDDAASLYRRYYALVGCAAASGLFDFVAHLDYVMLWGRRADADIATAENAASPSRSIPQARWSRPDSCTRRPICWNARAGWASPSCSARMLTRWNRWAGSSTLPWRSRGRLAIAPVSNFRQGRRNR